MERKGPLAQQRATKRNRGQEGLAGVGQVCKHGHAVHRHQVLHQGNGSVEGHPHWGDLMGGPIRVFKGPARGQLGTGTGESTKRLQRLSTSSRFFSAVLFFRSSTL